MIGLLLNNSGKSVGMIKIDWEVNFNQVTEQVFVKAK